jgi:hypothetical protein
LATAREGHAAVRLGDGRVLIIGGTVPLTGKCAMACINPPLASVEIYDARSGKFSHNGSLAMPRTDERAVLLNDGRVLVSGGDYGDSPMEIYDPARKTSVAVKLPAGTPKLPGDSSVVLLADGRVLIAGGFWSDVGTISNLTFIFDPARGELSSGPTMADSREGAIATLLHDGRVLMVGGINYDPGLGSAHYNAEIIDPSQPLAKPEPLDSQNASTSALLTDGRVLVAGGVIDQGAAICATPAVPQVFDPGTEKFTRVSPTNTPRRGSTEILIQDGRVLFFGGTTADCGTAGTVEAFDPDSGTFQVVATGFPDIGDFSATLLDDGEILIAGGHTSEWKITDASWLLKP